MAIAARVSSKGQITLPKAVRVALGIGDAAWDDVVRTARLARRYPGR